MALDPNSPPTDSPCSSRAATSRMGAASPIVANDGVAPIRNDPAPIMITERLSALRRP